jgi:two-component system, cell cycle sensor histidine kinase and response regulator CckA
MHPGGEMTEKATDQDGNEGIQLARENAIMAEIGSIINSSLEIDDVYERFTEEVRKLVPFDRIAINLVNLKENCTRIAYVNGIGVTGRDKGDAVTLEGSLSGDVIKRRSGLFIPTGEIETYAARYPVFQKTVQTGFRSLMLVPLFSKGEIIAILHFRSTLADVYSERELRVAERVGYQITSAIVNAQIYAEQKRIEKALRESEQRFRDLYDNAPSGYHEYDLEGKITQVNRTELQILGYSREEMVGRYIWDFNVEREFARKDVLARLRGGWTAGEIERTFRRRDGSTLPVLITNRLIQDAQGQITGVRSTLQDITARKQAEEELRRSEERYRSLYDEAPVGYIEYDANGIITSVNRREAEMLGYEVEEILGRDAWYFVVEKEDAERIIRGKLEGKIPPSKALERIYRRKDGTAIPVIIGDVILRDAEGRITGVRATIQDISERKRVEEEKERLQNQLLQAQRMESVGRLAGGVAHDFNNMLGIIIGHSEIAALRSGPDDPVRQSLEQILKAAKRSADIVRQLLAFARKQIISPRVLDLNSTVSESLKMLQRLIGEDIILTWMPGKDIWSVRMDPSQIEQILANLLVNSRDAMPNGGRITLESAKRSISESYGPGYLDVVPGDYVLLAVSDTGMGMSREVVEKIFEPFFTTKEVGRGTGLGLSTVYGIVNQNHGFIHVYSEPGQGTTFKIYLPRCEEEIPPQERSKGGEAPKGQETVLLVEDEEPLLEIARSILEKQGYKVLQAATPVDALSIAAKHPAEIHLVIADVILPQMNGRELVERLQATRPGIQCLYMSGYTANVIAHRGILDRGLNFIEKPFSSESLSEKVREVLDTK